MPAFITIDPTVEHDIYLRNSSFPLGRLFSKGKQYEVIEWTGRRSALIHDDRGIERVVGVGIGAGNGFLYDALGGVVDFVEAK